jgi:PAS domain S-box-containing protein
MQSNLNNFKQLDTGLPDSPDLLAGIIGSAMDAIIAIDDAQRIVLFNPAAEKIFACPANEAVGGSVERFIPERFRAGHSVRVHRFAESGITNRTLHGLGTLRGLRATGEEFPIEASISNVESGGKRFFTVVIRDITERQRAEEALRISEERLRLAQQAARIGAFERDVRTGLVTWTAELEQMYGLPAGAFDGTSVDFFESLVHADDRAGLTMLIDRALTSGEPVQGEWRVIWPDGSVHWIAGRWQVYMNESGQPSRMVGVNIDITDHKLAAQALARANERLHLAIDSGSVGGWDFDLKTDWNVWFGKAHAQLGMAPEETLGSRQEFWDRVHEGDREHLRHAIRVARDKHEEFTEEFRVVWRDGTTHWLRSRGRHYYSANGQPERMLGISIDITERKMAEEARFRLAAIVESSEDAIASETLDGIIVSWNAGAQRIYGYTEAEAIGKPIGILLPPELEEEENKILETLTAGGRIAHFETIRVTKSGKRIGSERESG